MNFNKHSNLEDEHAFLSPSNNAWLRYDDEKLVTVYESLQAKKRGTILHDYARRSIELREKLSNSKATLHRYVNDCIGYRMTPEVTLYYSPLCFGKTDAISFKDSLLRISDLKTGVIPAGFDQLISYAALFYLEYKIRPENCHTELRIYQNDEIRLYEPDTEEIIDFMDRIIHKDEVLSKHILMEG